MDFILKDDFCEIRDRIYECILNAQKKYAIKSNELQKTFSCKVFDKVMIVSFSQILFFETATKGIHKIKLHTTDSVAEFHGTLREVERKLDENFYRCHHSYIVNLNKVSRLETNEKEVYLNGDVSCPVSDRRMKALVQLLRKTNIKN